MKISLFDGDQPITTKYVDAVMDIGFSDLAEVICNHSWSPFCFSSSTLDDGSKVWHRLGKNFKSTDVLVLDVDDGCTLNQAKKDFEGFQVIIATTQNHQKPKGDSGVCCDRFRVIIPLERRITSKEQYLATWLEAQKRWPYIDKSCKDVARFYKRCRKVAHSAAGVAFPVATAAAGPRLESSRSSATNGQSARGKLFSSTLEFIAHGAPKHEWHHRMLKATFDLKAKGYPMHEATDLLRKATRDFSGDLDEEHDLPLIKDVYQNREPNFSGTMLKRVFSPPTSDEIRTQVRTEREQRKFAMANSLPFVCSAFDDHFKLTSGLILLLGKSGNGKSTLAANIVARIIEEDALTGRRILVITNEETTEDVYSRVACLLAGKDWKKYRREQLNKAEMKEIRKFVENLIKVLIVIPALRESWDMTALEDVKSVLEYVRDNQSDHGMVLIDYLQTISTSRSSPQKASYEISKEFGFFLKQFAQVCVTPVLLFAQIKDAREASDIASQIQNDRTIYNHAQTVIEIRPDFDVNRTTFILHKQRFGDRQGLKIECEWREGRFEPILEHNESEEEFSGF
ncbi:MAG: hypothetical protein K2Q26_03615 [Bdellovibrionales bacterium]|nr:hypothetical protein [Bdellovibrionales bacterium]